MKFEIVIDGKKRVAVVDHVDVDEVIEWAERRWRTHEVEVNAAPQSYPVTHEVHS